MTISIICAATDNHVIGKDGDMPWHMPSDLQYFKRTTLRHHILMGRKTFEAFGNGSPLPKRVNIVISRQKNLNIHKVHVCHSIEAGLALAKKNGETECFIIGGQQIYELGLPLCHKIYLTRIHTTLEGDTFFPAIDNTKWTLTSAESHPADERNQYPYTFTVWERK